MARKPTAPQVRALRSGAAHPRGVISQSEFQERTIEVLVGLGYADWHARIGLPTVGIITDAGRDYLAQLDRAEAQRAELQRMVDAEAARPAQGPQAAPQAPADTQEVPSTPNTPAAPQEGPQGRSIIGRWESDGGTYWVELYRDAHGYGYDGKGCGGFIGNVTEAEAVRFIEPKTVGGAAHFHPGKRPMKRTITPAAAPQSDAEAAALLTADDVAEAVVRALRWLGYGAARRRAEAQPASVVLADDFKRARRVMRRVMKNGAAPVANDALNQYTAAHRVLLAARRIEAEAAQGPQGAHADDCRYCAAGEPMAHAYEPPVTV